MKDLELTRQLLAGLQQTDEWDRIWKEDPWIRTSKDRLEKVADQIEASVPIETFAKLWDELWDTMLELKQANENATILYGIRVGLALREGLDHPDELSRYLMERRGQRKVVPKG